MPQLVYPIDVIALRVQRDVLFVSFPELEIGSGLGYHKDTYPPRLRLMDYLTEQGIPWEKCAYPSDSGMLEGGTELIYLDVPFDREDANYRLAADYLETPEGVRRDPRVRFLCMPLAQAVRRCAASGWTEEGPE